MRFFTLQRNNTHLGDWMAHVGSLDFAYKSESLFCSPTIQWFRYIFTYHIGYLEVSILRLWKVVQVSNPVLLKEDNDIYTKTRYTAIDHHCSFQFKTVPLSHKLQLVQEIGVCIRNLRTQICKQWKNLQQKKVFSFVLSVWQRLLNTMIFIYKIINGLVEEFTCECVEYTKQEITEMFIPRTTEKHRINSFYVGFNQFNKPDTVKNNSTLRQF